MHLETLTILLSRLSLSAVGEAATPAPAWSDLQAALPPLVLFVTGTVVLGIDLFLRGFDDRPRPGEKGVLYFLSLLGTLAAAALSFAALQTGATGTYFIGALRVDPFTSGVSLVILAGTFLTLLAAADSLPRLRVEHGEFHCLVLYAAGAMILFAGANNLLMVFLSLETLSMAVYVLTAFQRDERRSVEGGLKYFVLGGLAAGFLLFGLVLIYGATGTIQLDGILDIVRQDGAAPGRELDIPLLVAGLALALVGLAFKVGAFPFHAWVPDAYEGAPAVASGFMAVTVKAAGFAVLLRVVVGFGVVAGFDRMQTVFVPVLEVVAVATMVFGNLVALVQQSVKRMLAYSAIAHTGYLLVGVVASAYAENGAAGGSAAAATLFYLVPYSLMSLGAFALLGHVSKNGEDRERFEDYRGLAQERPFLALGLLVILVSFAGIPPTAGFWGKLLVFRAAVLSGHWFLALVGILTSVVSLAYYLRLVVNFYMRPAEAPFGGDSEAPPRLAGTLVIAAAAVLIIVLGVFPGWGVELSEISAQALVRKH